MKIDNQTRYATGPLRELVRRVAEVELDPEKRRRMTVHFQETRGVSKDGALGRCALGGDHPRIFLPKDARRLRPNVLASTLAHEFAHARGMTHSDMRGDPRYSWHSCAGVQWDQVVEARRYIAGLEFTMKPRATVMRPTDELKLQGAAAHLKAWDARRRRAETGIKKWRAKVRYYEQKIAAKTTA
ncbi:MAG: hypothetical protein ACREIS_08180 [Nitrospiraceae bacterium]